MLRAKLSNESPDSQLLPKILCFLNINSSLSVVNQPSSEYSERKTRRDRPSGVSLSIMLVCRNDNYMGNYQYRLRTCINYLARNLHKLGRLEDVEVVVADWNSDVPIAKTIPLLPAAADVTRFVYVPPAIASQVQQPDQVFHSSYSMNTALRRAQGEYLMMIDADTLAPYSSLQSIFHLLEGDIPLPLPRDRCFFLGDRRHIPWEVVQKEPSLAEWDSYLLKGGGELLPDEGWAGLGVCKIAWLAHRSIWEASRGFHQQLHYWGWNDAELTLRITQHYPWLNLSSLGIPLFHLEHWSGNRRTVPQQRNPHPVSREIAVNDENWGLGHCELAVHRGENICDRLESDRASKITWEKTAAQIVEEIAGETVTQYLEELSPAIGSSLSEPTASRAIAWYSLSHRPHTYLEFGISTDPMAALVAAACPNVEIYGLDSWDRTDAIPQSPDEVTKPLKILNYRGYARFVTGDLSAAFGRLQESSVGSLALDLVLFRGDLFPQDAGEQLQQLVPHLSPVGAIALTCQDAELFQQLWHQTQSQFSNLTYLKLDANTGLIAAATLAKPPEERPQEDATQPTFLSTPLAWDVTQLQRQLEEARETIQAMESSKFWQLRKAWVKIKRIFQ